MTTTPTLRIVFAAGGTGGHVFPAMAVIDALQRRDIAVQIGYVGRVEGLEEREARKRNLDYLGLRMKGFRRRITTDLVVVPALMKLAVLRCLSWIRRFRPDVVVGFGGYASWPALVAGVLLRQPTMLHEQNRNPGLANRVLAPWVRKVLVSDTDAQQQLRNAQVIGVPIRPDVVHRDRQQARREWKLDPNLPTILVFGGSLGARAVSVAACEAFQLLEEAGVEFQAILQTGAKTYAEFAQQHLPPRVQVVEFIDDMGAVYAAADLVVSRAGAVSVAEITANGKPAILVPYPFATGRHQHKNAEALADAGAARVIDQDHLTGQLLASAIRDCLDPRRLTAMADASRELGHPEAAERFVDEILATAGWRAA